MRQARFHISSAALLALAALYYLSTPGEAAAAALPILCHEMGHILVLYILGLRIREIRIELKGFCIEYSGYTGALGHALAAAAGPLAGGIYAFAAAMISKQEGPEWLLSSAGISLALSLFNLLPTMPLDGGRIFAALACAVLGERAGTSLAEGLSLLLGILLLAAGIYSMLLQHGIALALAGIWVLLYQDPGQGIVKKREVL